MDRTASTDTSSADTPSPVDWALAERVGVRVAARALAVPRRHQPGQAEMDDLVGRAEELVAASTGLRPPTTARATILGRDDWVRANLVSFRRLLNPVWDRWLEARPEVARSARSVGPKVTATQMGMLLGWMSARVLGQYDLLVAGDDPDTTVTNTTDAVYFVGPNMGALEQKYAFVPGQFRLWVALHEVTHRAQFRGVPWMREHYLGLVDETLTMADPDLTRFAAALRTALTDRGASREALRDGGAVALLAGPEQREALGRIAGLMSLLEGHGDVTMDRAGAHLLPDAARMAHVLRMRRRNTAPLTKLFQTLIGLEAKLDQYRAGEAFIAAVESHEGATGIDRCWERPENLPTLAEIRDPQAWIARTTDPSRVGD